MTLEEFRKARGLSQAQLAETLGLRSKGSISFIERGARFAPLKLALQIEAFSDGDVPAETLVASEDRELLRAIRRRPGKSAPAGAAA